MTEAAQRKKRSNIRPKITNGFIYFKPNDAYSTKYNKGEKDKASFLQAAFKFSIAQIFSFLIFCGPQFF